MVYNSTNSLSGIWGHAVQCNNSITQQQMWVPPGLIQIRTQPFILFGNVAQQQPPTQ